MNSISTVAIAVIVLGAIAYDRPIATAQKETVEPTCTLTVPYQWGEFKGASRDFGLAFQDKDGTLRFIRDLGCETAGMQRLPAHYLEVRRK